MANNSVAYGFIGLADLFAQRVAEIGTARIYDAITESLAEYSKIADGILAGWSQRTTVAQEQIELPGTGTLQPLDEWGNPLPVKPSGSYQVAYPIQGAGTAFGDNRISRALITVEETNRLLMDAMQRDKDWLIRHALAALFTNTTWTYNDKAAGGGYKGLGDITIQPLANGDSVTYGRVAGGAPATDTHYLAQAAAISDTDNPFPTIATELNEHPSNRGPLVAYVASNLTTGAGNLTELVEVGDPDIMLGANSDTIAAAAETVLGPGKEVIGKTKSGVWVVEMPAIPSDYMLVVATGADQVLRQREWPAAELQGFFTEMHSPDGNLEITRLLRYCGFGVRNRVGALVMRIGNGTYAIPSGYTAPLPV